MESCGNLPPMVDESRHHNTETMMSRGQGPGNGTDFERRNHEHL